ncbi:glycoside transporter [Erythrobacter sp. KY5]|uniref:MFS transporter n=1 Tax=Erythrobacter sp. KY5 TaxID=2011159 RepID=UPI000DBEF9F6|nr:glycoside-pentoside-hexuronide (GPH):cation symporter [Erythrobacter sp. KY5]AWW74423.1 glycoside transporter [Erythrobacter sp. KY5]
MSHPKQHTPLERLPFGRIFGYGLGDFGFNLFYTGLNLYLLYYYTDVLEIPPATAGLIFMLPVIWDAITDPIMGAIASRTRTRWGPYRPYILFGGPVMALSYISMFAAPLMFPGAVVIASLVSHILFRTCYTVVSIPYTALSAAMSRDGAERSRIAGTRMVFAVGGGILTAFLTLSLARDLGGGDLKSGFIQVAVFFALIATGIMMVVFLATKEKVSKRDTHAPAVPAGSLRQSIGFLRANSAFWILFAAVFLGALGSSVGSKALVYYVTYVVEEPEQVSTLLTVSLLVTGASIPLWAWAGTRYSKRDVWFCGALGSVIAQAAMLILAPREMSQLYWLVCLAACFNGAFVTMFWAMLPDTVEFGEWRSGFRDEAIVFGLNQFALKAASGLGVGALGLALSLVGYIANERQTAETLEGLAWLSFGIPLIAAVLTAIVIRQSPLTRRKHDALVKWLERGRRPS